MKPRPSKQRNRAFNTLELVVLIFTVIILLLAILLPMLAAAKLRSSRINCTSNLKQVNLAFRIWPPAQDGTYPMSVSVTNGGAKELIATGNVAACFQIISNELATPKILICPNDTIHTCATNWVNFSNSNISYFVGVDADERYPQGIMSGDDNFIIGGMPVKPGLLVWTTNLFLSWATDRHGHVGNLAYADGSVAEVSDSGLQQSLILATNGTPFATNRFAIP